MMSNASRRAAQQMERDGIHTLPRWSKGRSVGYATVRTPLVRPRCGQCHKVAGYSTPSGPRCFLHALAQDTTPVNAKKKD